MRYHVQSIRTLHRDDKGFKSHIVVDRSWIAFIDSPICGLHWDADMMSRWSFRIVPSQHRTLTLARTPDDAYVPLALIAALFGEIQPKPLHGNGNVHETIHDAAFLYGYTAL